jgi:aspartate racemase
MTFPSPLIGILGGMGPQAGLDLAEKLMGLTRTSRDQDHLPFILFSLPEMVSDRTAFLLGQQPVNPAGAIADQFEQMASAGCTLAVMACNTAHAGPIFDVAMDLLKERGVKLRILHMVRETVAYIAGNWPGIRRVGILGTQGTYKTRLYDRALESAGLEALVPEAGIRERVHDAIYSTAYGIKARPGGISEEAGERIGEAIRHLLDLGAEAIILGCTELPLAVTEKQVDGIPILDPAMIIAEKLIRETCPEKLVKPA